MFSFYVQVIAFEQWRRLIVKFHDSLMTRVFVACYRVNLHRTYLSDSNLTTTQAVCMYTYIYIYISICVCACV